MAKRKRRVTRESLQQMATIGDGQRVWDQEQAQRDYTRAVQQAYVPNTPSNQPKGYAPGGTPAMRPDLNRSAPRSNSAMRPDLAPREMPALPDILRRSLITMGLLPGSSLEEGEADKYSAGAIAAANADQDENAALTPMQRAMKGRFMPSEERAALILNTASSTSPLVGAGVRSQYDRQLFLEQQFPALAAAQKRANLSDDQLKKVTNFTLAVDAAKKITESVDPQRKAELLQTMPPIQQALVLDVIKTMADVAKEKLEAAQADPSFLQQGMMIAGVPVSMVFDALMWANDQTQHAARAAMFARTGVNPLQAWQDTEHGDYNPQMIQFAREKYGDKPVDIILEFQRAAREGVDDPAGALIQKYEQDPQSLKIIDTLLNRLSSNQEMMDLAQYIDSADQGNTGNLMSWSLLSGPQGDGFAATEAGFDYANSTFFSAFTNAGNVTATVVLDPTLAGGKLRGAYIMARYGLGNLAKAEGVMASRLDKVFQTKGVQRYFDDLLGPQLRAINEEANIGKRAQMFNSLSAQHRKFFKPEALAQMEAAGVKDAESALRFFDSAEGVYAIWTGQGAKRARQVVVPHMTRANVVMRKTMMKVRGLTWEKEGSARWVDGVMGSGTSARFAEYVNATLAEEYQVGSQIRVRLVQRLQDDLAARLAEDGADREIGEFLSQFMFADGVAKRTYVGKMIDLVVGREGIRSPIGRGAEDIRMVGNVGVARTNSQVTPARFAIARYGYAKKHHLKGSPRARLQEISRLMSHRPDSANGIYIADGRDADMVRQLFLQAGVTPYWANVSKYLWVHSNEAQRKIAANGIARTFGYAVGMHIVDPELGTAEIGRMAESIGQRYAPDVVNIAAMRREAKNIRAKEVRANKAAVAERNKLIKQAEETGNLDLIRGLPDIPAPRNVGEIFDGLKQQWIQNPGQFVDDSGVTQNAAVFFSQTAPRVHLPDLAKAEALGVRQSMLQALLGNNIGVQSLTDLWVVGTLLGPRFQMRSGIEDAGLYAVTGGSWRGWRYGRLYASSIREATGQKLGILKTSNRRVGDILESQSDAADDVWASLQSLFLPHLNPQEVAAANKAMEMGDRAAVIDLVKKATLRRRLKWIPGWKPSAKQAEIEQYIDDLIRVSDNPLDSMGEVSETSAHLVDGTMPRSRFAGVEETNENTIFIGGVPYQVRQADGAFTSRAFGETQNMGELNGIRQAHQEWWDNLVLVVGKDGVKGKKAVELVKRYHAAVNAKTPDSRAVQKVVDELAAVIEQSDTPYLTRMVHGQREGAKGLARRTLDATLALFSDGSSFNDDLWRKLVKYDDEGNAIVRMSDDGVVRVTPEDLVEMSVKPMSVLAPAGLPVVAPKTSTWARTLWDMTGRSLARMTREPIFLANYIDTRKALVPFQKEMEARFGSEFASRWAVEISERRAVELSMSYLDNPAVRSQLAWNVRNVARFYRATEDFNRRMLRVAKNQPMAYWRLALGWNILDDTGFVHTDEFNQKYFVWPGTGPAMEMVNRITAGLFGVDPMMPGAQIGWGSRVNMLTPSADPNSWTPTLSGPYTALALKPLMRMLPALGSLEDEVFGEYSPGTAVWRGVLPPNLVRAIDTVQTLSGDYTTREGEAGTPFATYYRQAAQIFGYNNPAFDAGSLSNDDLTAAREQIDMMAVDMTLWKFITGFVSPAAQNPMPLTVTDFARSVGVDGIREEFAQLMRKYPNDPGKAFAAWWKMNPNLSVFTVGSNNTNYDVGTWPATKEITSFINTHKDFILQSDGTLLGSSFFAPQEFAPSANNLSQWKYLQRLGVYTPKQVDQIFNEMVTAKGYQEYQLLKAQAEDLKAAGDETADTRWYNAKQDLMSRYPLLDSRLNGELKSRGAGSPGDYARDVEDIRKAAEYFKAKGHPDAQKYLDALDTYDSAMGIIQKYPNKSDSDVRSDIRARWSKGFLPEQVRLYGDDDKFKSFLYVMTRALEANTEIL